MDFDSFMGQSWDDHADDAGGVAQRLREQGVGLLTNEAQLVQLMNLTHHVHGEHLHEWAGGAARFDALKASEFYVADGESGQTARRCVASLLLSAQEDFSLAALSVSDQIRVQAMAAANLANINPIRGMRLLQAALDQAANSGLPPADAMNRALAVSGHNLAAALEEKAVLNDDEIRLMLMASQASRVYWELAGTWLQVERAEYQLATTFLKAGELVQAEIHARECGRIVAENKAPALERFFGFEALARVMRAAQNDAEFELARGHAQRAFEDLDEGDKSWCEASFNKLHQA
jgi:hypothetical protein